MEMSTGGETHNGLVASESPERFVEFRGPDRLHWWSLRMPFVSKFSGCASGGSRDSCALSAM